MNVPLRVLCITGNSRSGSTLMGTLLNEVQGVFCAGELQRIWDRGWLIEERCSCGAPILRCPIWGRIFADLTGTYDANFEKRLRQARNRIVHLQGLPRLLTTRAIEDLPEDIREYVRITEKLYHQIKSQTGCEVIVDTSKYPTYSYLLRLIPSLDIRVVHLVRDPRATAYSWQRLKSYPAVTGTRHMERHTPPRSAIAWTILNSIADLLWSQHSTRYIRLRYEDFVESPESTLRAVLRFIGMSHAELPLSNNDIDISENHVIAGNANRFRKGRVKLSADVEWRQKLSKASQAIVVAMTFPLMRRYGYFRERSMDTDSAREKISNFI